MPASIIPLSYHVRVGAVFRLLVGLVRFRIPEDLGGDVGWNLIC